ncbi:MAG TPA: hypothetical protein VG452_11085 [Egibacteraceae bacterium]|nr:hypothetical protein [Actinomycetota bacterium]HWB72751.1 hypothetical protein [Egibacteraceae bacterium]
MTATRTRTLRLELPVADYLRARQHHDDIRREFALIALRAEEPASADVPRRLLQLTDELRAHYGAPRDRLAEAVEEARSRGESTAAVDLQVPLELADKAVAWLALVEEADAYCRAGDLLTLESPPDVVRLRQWLVAEIVGQLREGRPSRPYPG